MTNPTGSEAGRHLSAAKRPRPAPALVPSLAIEAMSGAMDFSGGDAEAEAGRVRLCGQIDRGPEQAPVVAAREWPQGGESIGAARRLGEPDRQPSARQGMIDRSGLEWPRAQSIDLEAMIGGKASRPSWWPGLMPWPHPTFAGEYRRLQRERIEILDEIDARGGNRKPGKGPPGFRDDGILVRRMTLDSGIGALQVAMRLHAEAMIAAAYALDRNFRDKGMMPIETSSRASWRERVRNLDSVTSFMSVLASGREVRARFEANVALMARDRLMTHDRSLVVAGQSLACTRPTAQAMDVMMMEARSRGWPSVAASGTPDFMKAIIAAGERHGMAITDRDSGRTIYAPKASEAVDPAADPTAGRPSAAAMTGGSGRRNGPESEPVSGNAARGQAVESLAAPASSARPPAMSVSPAPSGSSASSEERAVNSAKPADMAKDGRPLAAEGEAGPAAAAQAVQAPVNAGEADGDDDFAPDEVDGLVDDDAASGSEELSATAGSGKIDLAAMMRPSPKKEASAPAP